MKLRNYFLMGGAVVLSLLASSCKKDGKEDLGTPKVSINPTELTFAEDGRSKTISLTATRKWTATVDCGAATSPWISVRPAKGEGSAKPQTITITVLENEADSYNRTGTVKFDIGYSSKTLKVNQAGDKGDSEGVVAYSNNFDKAETSANTKLKDSEDWHNEAGTGIESVTYGCSTGVDVRKSGPSDGSKNGTTSTYSGSGKNSIYFTEATEEYFRIANIATTGTDFNLSFGLCRYNEKISAEQFGVYVSDGTDKWVKLNYTVTATNNDEWELITIPVSVPANTTKLYIQFVAAAGGAYRLDDVKLAASESAATTVLDFANGTSLEGEDDTITPPPAETCTLAEALAKADNTPVEISDELLVMAINTNTMILSDGTNYVSAYYDVNNKNDEAVLHSKVKAGDKILISATKTTSQWGITQLASPTKTEVKSSNNTVTQPEPTNITSSFATYTSTGTQYVTFIGKMAKSGNYYNVNVDGVTARQGSISNPASTLNADSFDGKYIVVTGYYIGLSSSKYVTILATNIEEDSSAKTFVVSPEAINLAATATSAIFTIASNVEWTITAEEGATITNLSWTTDPAGATSGNATVTVTFDANTANSGKKAILKVTTTNANVVKDEYSVVIGQGAVLSANAKTDELTASGLGITSSSYTAFTDKIFTSSAVYAGQIAYNSSKGKSIQMRATNPSAIITTTSGGKARKVIVTWVNDDGNNNRIVDVYGKSTPYTGGANLYDNNNSSNQGKKIGSIAYGTSTTLEIADDYEYIGLRSATGAMYLAKIEIVWD